MRRAAAGAHRLPNPPPLCATRPLPAPACPPTPACSPHAAAPLHLPPSPLLLSHHCCSYYGLKPDIKVIAPWREWDLNSRTKLIEYAEERGIGVPAGKRNEPPFSMDANLLHISYEG